MSVPAQGPAATGNPLPREISGDRQKRLIFRAVLVIIAAAFGSVIAELGLRVFYHSLDWDERSMLYQYHPQLGWFPSPGSRGTFTGCRTISIAHNSSGFRGPEHVITTNQPSIIFLGDSFVWGFDVEAEERFTEKLQARHPDWAIYNFGVSGYGTDQEYLLLQQTFDRYRPRIVFLVFCVDNDDSDNCWNFRWGYYKPYCVLNGTRLELQGIPVPRGARVFGAEHPVLCRSYLVRLGVRTFFAIKGPPAVHRPGPTGPLLWDLNKFVRSKGAVFIAGITHRLPQLEEFFENMNIPWVDLSSDQLFPAHGRHWTPEGHSWVADQIEQRLLQGNYLQKP